MEDRGRSLRRAATLTAAVGALHAILFLVAYFLLAGAPGPQATDEEIYAGFVVGAFMLPSVSLTPLLLLRLPGMAHRAEHYPAHQGEVDPARGPAAVGDRGDVRAVLTASGR